VADYQKGHIQGAVAIKKDKISETDNLGFLNHFNFRIYNK